MATTDDKTKAKGIDATGVGVSFLFAWPIFVMAYDVWLGATGRQTISNRTMNLSKKYPVLACLLGLLVGGLLTHLFFYQTAPTGGPEMLGVILSPTAIGSLLGLSHVVVGLIVYLVTHKAEVQTIVADVTELRTDVGHKDMAASIAELKKLVTDFDAIKTTLASASTPAPAAK